MTTEEEIKIKLGFNAEAVTRGTNDLLDKQKRAANDYVNFWKKAISDRERAEIDYDVRAAARANKAAKLTRVRAVVQAERAAVRDAEIAAGSIPANLAGGALGGAAAGVAAKNVHGLGGIVRELGVLAREAYNGNWHKMLSSFTVLLSRMGSFAVYAARISAALAGIVGGYYMVKATLAERAFFKADAESNASNESLTAQSRMLGKKLGLGDNATTSQVIAKQRELMTLQDESFRKQHEAELKSYEQAVQKNRLLKEHAEWQKVYLQRVQQVNSMLQEAAGLRRNIAEAKNAISNIDRAVPTIADLAGRSYSTQLERDYGAGGRYDIADGNGPLAQAAREALLASKQQMWDVTHGNYAQAELDRKKQMMFENQLSAAGLETPAMREKSMRESLKNLETSLQALMTRAAGEGIRIADTDNP
jgi:hypothetical protein